MQLCSNGTHRTLHANSYSHTLVLGYISDTLKSSGFFMMGLLSALHYVVFEHYACYSPVASPETSDIYLIAHSLQTVFL